MRCIAAFDIGTTAVKAVLVGFSGEEYITLSRDIPILLDHDIKEQDPEEWWHAFCELSRLMIAECPDHQICGIVMSGQMQDVIPVGRDLRAVIEDAVLPGDAVAAAAEEAADPAKCMEEGKCHGGNVRIAF